MAGTLLWRQPPVTHRAAVSGFVSRRLVRRSPLQPGPFLVPCRPNDNTNDNINGDANDDNDYDYDDGDTYNMRTRTTTATSARVQQRRPVRSPSRVGTGRHHNPAAAEHLPSLVILGYSFSELDTCSSVAIIQPYFAVLHL